MGGGLTFLNKKPWHPGSLQNIDKVSKRENEADKIKKKAQERIDTLKKERECENLFRLDHGIGDENPRDTTLDWIYGGSIAVKQNADSRDLTKVDVKHNLENQLTSCHQETFKTSSSSQGTFLVSKSEMWHRMLNDPLVNIKHQEQIQRQTIRENPTIMSKLSKEMTSSKPVARMPDKEYNKDEKIKSTQLKRSPIHGSELFWSYERCAQNRISPQITSSQNVSLMNSTDPSKFKSEITKKIDENYVDYESGFKQTTNYNFREVKGRSYHMEKDKKKLKQSSNKSTNKSAKTEHLFIKSSEKAHLSVRTHTLRRYISLQNRAIRCSEKQKWALTEMKNNSKAYDVLKSKRGETNEKDIRE